MTQPLSSPLDPALYRETLARLDLRAVRLHELHMKCHREVVGNAKINISTDAGFRREEGALLIDARYKLDASNETNALFTVEMTFVVALSAPEELPQDFVEVYIANNLNLTVFPYVRELVASLTARMGLPSLTLPYVVNQYEKTEAAKTPDRPKTRSRRKKAAD